MYHTILVCFPLIKLTLLTEKLLSTFCAASANIHAILTCLTMKNVGKCVDIIKIKTAGSSTVLHVG